MKSVMISIRPKWCKLIANGKKTIEVRKTKPKIKTPFRCYIYETKGKIPVSESLDKIVGGKVIGKYVCDKLVWVISHPTIFAGHDLLHEAAIKAACMSDDEAQSYSQGKNLYGWHISDLEIYDEPLELTDFIHPTNGCVNEGKCSGCRFLDRGMDGILEDDCFADFDTDRYSILKRPPQSWCYVKEVE